MSSIALKRFLAFPLKKTAIRRILVNRYVGFGGGKNNKTSKISWTSTFGGRPHIEIAPQCRGSLIGPPTVRPPRWAVSVSGGAVWGCSQCGGSDIADIAPPTLWLELQPQTTPLHDIRGNHFRTAQKTKFRRRRRRKRTETKQILKRS